MADHRTRRTSRQWQWILLTISASQLLPPCRAYVAGEPPPSGCKDGSAEQRLQRGDGGQQHESVAPCDGRWDGHIANSSALCAAGWTVCGSDTVEALRSVSWNDAMALSGCYAVNAAQFSGQCRPCRSRQDTLAGVGSGCPHRRYGSDSCIAGGQMDIVNDDSTAPACGYVPGIVTGVLCCQLIRELPRIVIEPVSLTHVRVGEMFVLSCQAVGTPQPRVYWLRDDQLLPVDSNQPRRVAVFQSGYLIVSAAQSTDSGVYKCLASNALGNVTAPARVVVTEYPSGCASGRTNGLAEYEEVQACTGRWTGHVKRAARSLCAHGWQVCSPRHSTSLTLLTWSDVTRLPGCYAYNAANTLNLCSVCREGAMAGVGRDCGRHRTGRRSCLADGLIDVLSTGQSSAHQRRRDRRHHRSKPCHFVDGVTTGVLCCKRPQKWQSGYNWIAPRCKPACQNGGVCVADGRCQCAPGYKGALCQNPICRGGCIPNAECVRPSLCRCRDGFSGPKCKRTESDAVTTTHAMSSNAVRRRPHGESPNGAVECRCLHGGRCLRNGRCKCRPGFHGHRCSRRVVDARRKLARQRRKKQSAVEINRTEP